MTETSRNNFFVIENLVKNCFGLSKDSFLFFKEKLYKPDIPEEIAPFLDEDYRYKIDLEKENILESIDPAWDVFCESFYSILYYIKYIQNQGHGNNFFIEFDYGMFRKGVIKIDKNTYRLKKGLLKFYSLIKDTSSLLFNHVFGTGEEAIEENFSNRIDEIMKIKQSKKTNMKIVLSYNFADWFLCATSESWSSCLNLESEYAKCYWSGLPGLLGDPNRAMLYITDDDEKEYQGIITDRFLVRSWLVLTDENEYACVRFFPSDLKPEPLSGLFPFKLHSHHEWKSKHKVNLLYHKNNDSCFIYKDYHVFAPDFFLHGSSEGSMEVFNSSAKDYHGYSTSFEFKKGVMWLKETEQEITDFIVTHACISCGRMLAHDLIYAHGGDEYCESCYEETFVHCGNCDDEIYIDDAYEHDNFGYLCERCHRN
jgi:hypothetical protein